MANNITNYLEQKLMDLALNQVAFSGPATYIALYTVTPSDAGGGTEVTGGSYARILVNPNSGAAPKWNLAVEVGTAYRVDNLSDIVFATATADWGTVVAVAILDVSSNFLWWGPLTAQKVVSNGDTFKFAAGDLDVELD